MDEVTILAPIENLEKTSSELALNYTEHESARTWHDRKITTETNHIFKKPTTNSYIQILKLSHQKKLTEQLIGKRNWQWLLKEQNMLLKKMPWLRFLVIMVINDISARDCRREGQWIVSKDKIHLHQWDQFSHQRRNRKNPHNLNLLQWNGAKSKTQIRNFYFQHQWFDWRFAIVFTLEPEIIAPFTIFMLAQEETLKNGMMVML
jgi:hypothetical protein